MHQLALLPEVVVKDDKVLTRSTFSHNGICDESERLELESRYQHLLEETDEFNRQLVSFQANKTEVLHSWMKYREGFSATLVEILIKKFGLTQEDTLLDPFAGSGTTLLVAQMLGINATGIELLPHSYLAWKAKSQAFEYAVEELKRVRKLIEDNEPPTTDAKFPHLTITETAFPEDRERDLMAYTQWFKDIDISRDTKLLGQLILTSILEDISYTRKDGQYLRWDGRAEKVQLRNEARLACGKKPTKGIDKGKLPSVKEAIINALTKIIYDISDLQRDPPPQSKQELIHGNTLYSLPKIQEEQFMGVITSPPYANRYDYTRTYALELAYLGVEEKIFKLRQRQLSCTVENKSKIDHLRRFYQSIGQQQRFQYITNVIQGNRALAEVNTALKIRNQRGDINNKGVLTMIAQYFSELTFVFAELHRTCCRGAQVAFVNDNVRYAGEVIPVDLISTSLAEEVGFTPVKVYVLPQRKGNSSQQMGKFGREALRKSITIWEKF